MNAACKKYGLDYKLVQLLVELRLDLVMHCKMKVNRILFSYYSCRDQKSFTEKQKK